MNILVTKKTSLPHSFHKDFFFKFYQLSMFLHPTPSPKQLKMNKKWLIDASNFNIRWLEFFFFFAFVTSQGIYRARKQLSFIFGGKFMLSLNFKIIMLNCRPSCGFVICGLVTFICQKTCHCQVHAIQIPAIQHINSMDQIFKSFDEPRKKLSTSE